MTSPADKLRALLDQPGAVVTPACFDALSARLIERAGFSLSVMSGFGVSAARLGLPDTGLISYAEMVEQGRNICGAVSIPVIGDADTGYGNALNVKRTVQGYAQAGFACAMIEDQIAPKRCGHTGGKQVVVVTQKDWIDANGKKMCEDVRTFTFGGDADTRTIDFEITLKATSGDVKLGDTKEGCFGIRVAGDMKPDSKKGGRLVNSEGHTDKNAWGKAAAWVDFHGPVEGERLGIAIMNHPSSFRYPTYWHVRTYGLFAANPFGAHDFEGQPRGTGDQVVPAGETITFRYRLLFHEGEVDARVLDERLSEFAD